MLIPGKMVSYGYIEERSNGIHKTFMALYYIVRTVHHIVVEHHCTDRYRQSRFHNISI